MISLDTVLTGVWSQLNSDTGLRSILGATGRVIKGAKRPDNLGNPSITVQMPVRILPGGGWTGSHPMLRTQTTPVLVAVFADNHANGAINEPLLSTLCANIDSITAAAKPTVTGATLQRIGQYEQAGPVFDASDPHEAYMILSFGWWMSETA